tara:strand:+ start:470 stop:1321 length:852 start_codon:yes stop_codon:yes gene_type:complete
MSNVFIFGATGALGSLMTKFLIKKNYKVFSDKIIKKKIKKKDNLKYLKKIIKSHNLDYIINLVALTNVDLCEKKKLKAKNSNFIFVKNLVRAIKKYKDNIHLIHISTDQVYNGKGNHIESNTNPINYYGKSKLQGEMVAKKTISTIFRTNYIGKTKKKTNLTSWIYNNLKKKNKINAFKNIYFSPLHVSTLVSLIEKSMKKKIVGVFNLGSKNKISKAEFAEKFSKIIGCNKNLINKTNYKEKNLLAKRPLDMSMKISKFEKHFCIKLPNVQAEINKLRKEYR